MGNAFRFQAYDQRGELVTGQIEAPRMPEALSQLEARGLSLFETIPDVTGAPILLRSIIKPMPLSEPELADFMANFGTLIGADLTLDRSLKLLAAEESGKRVKALVERFLARVLARAPLSSALPESVPSAPAFVSGLLRAGEAPGQIAEAVREIVRISRARLCAALAYPLLLAVIMVLVVGLVLITLISSLPPLFEGTSIKPPVIVMLASALRASLSRHALALAASLAVTVAIAAMRRRTGTVAAMRDRAATAIPVACPIISKARTAVPARTLGLPVENGVPIVKAVEIVNGLTACAVQRRELMRAAASIREGEALSRALPGCHLAEPALQYFAVGEEVNRLGHMLLQLASSFEAQVDRESSRALSLLGPAITILLGLVIGSILLSVMQTVLSINELAVR